MVLRSVLHTVLRHAAQDLLATRTVAGGELPNAPAECDIGFVFAMGVEAGGFEDLLADARSIRGDRFRAVAGTLDGRRVALVVTGMGEAAARRGTEALLAGHGPACVVSAGYSGGLRPGMELGDIVLADRITDRQGQELPVDLPIDAESARQPRLHIGRLLTSQRLVCLPEQKQTLGREHDALAVDMESWFVAETCRNAGVPFLAVRIISDDVDQQLPDFLDKYSLQKSLAGRTGVVLGALLKRPGSFKTLYAMREESVQLSDRLGRFLASLVRARVPAPVVAQQGTSDEETNQQ